MYETNYLFQHANGGGPQDIDLTLPITSTYLRRMRALGLAAGLDQAYKHPNNTLQLEVSFYVKPIFKQGPYVKLWLFSTEMNLFKRSIRSCHYMDLLDLLGAVHKRRRNLLGHLDNPLPHVGISNLICLTSTF